MGDREQAIEALPGWFATLTTVARLSSWAALAALLGYLGDHHWLLDLCAHFRWQYLLAMALGLAAALVVRRRGLALILVMVSLINAWSLVMATGPATAQAGLGLDAGEDPTALKLLVVNIHLANQDLDRLLTLIERESPAVVGIIELSPHAAGVLAVLDQRYPASRVEPRDDPFGIGVWSRLPQSRIDPVSMPPLDLPALQLHWSDPQPASLWLVHPFPPIGGDATGWRNAQLTYTGELIRGDPDAVLAGDFNATPWSAAYRHLREVAGLFDSSAAEWPWPTWFGPSRWSGVLAVPIDHVLHGAAWRVRSHRIGPDIGSDHRPLIVELVRATAGESAGVR